MNCSVCSKTFNGLTFNRTLFECKNLRICPDCAEKQRDFLRLSYQVDKNSKLKYEELKEYFTNFLSNVNSTQEVKIAIEELLSKGESNQEKVCLVKKEEIYGEIQGQEEKEQMNKAITNFLSTVGFTFEGYKIIKYHKVLCGETVLGTGFLTEFTAGFADFFGEESDKFANKLSLARESATQKLIKKAMEYGANAIIGLDFDYVNFTGNLIGVIANGTAVSVEEICNNN